MSADTREGGGFYWHTLDYRTTVFVDRLGRVHGGVDMEYRTWQATANAKILGSYITEDDARHAVEKAVTKLSVPRAGGRDAGHSGDEGPA